MDYTEISVEIAMLNRRIAAEMTDEDPAVREAVVVLIDERDKMVRLLGRMVRPGLIAALRAS